MQRFEAVAMEALPALVDRQFARAPGTVYLDTCARGLLPLVARDAVGRLMDDRVAGRVDKEALFATVERARERFAALVGAVADEVAITKNVSEGISIIAGAMPWQAGDNVVVCLDLEHPNNVYPWLNLQHRLGIEVRAVAQREGHIPADAVVEAIDARTRLVSLSTVSFSPGFRTDVAPVGRACRERGVLLLADGVQSVGVLDTDVEALGIDAMAVSTQKGLLGLYGFGFLYCRGDWAERLQPAALARFGVDLGQAHEAAMGSGQYELMPGARRFDLGNYNYAGAAAAAESLGVIAAVGTEAIESHVSGLCHRLAGGLFEMGLPVAGGAPGPHLASIVSVGEIGGGHDTTDDPRIGALYRHLTEHGVALTIRRGMLRMALHLYNTDEDIARVLVLARDWLKRG